MKQISILGATGSIGRQTLAVIEKHHELYTVFALSAGRDIETLLQQCCTYRPRFAVLHESAQASVLQRQLQAYGIDTEVLFGEEGLNTIASHKDVDIVVAAIVGAAGLPSSLAAAQAGKRILLANKEALVMAGELFMKTVREHEAQLLPVDSEHNALFQCLPFEKQQQCQNLSTSGVRRLVLTASGGPFRQYTQQQLEQVTPDQACQHPNWRMGRKISVDSATLMNKGLEVIEAHHLFGMPAEQLDVVIHPQSIIHSMVEYIDGSLLAQLSYPDMRIPIAHALAWPERVDAGAPALDMVSMARLDFEQVDLIRFPCLALAYNALRHGGTAPAILNAANEVAVAAFLQNEISFLAIPQIVEHVLTCVPSGAVTSLEQVWQADAAARAVARDWIANR